MGNGGSEAFQPVEMFEAVRSRDHAALQRLLEAGADPDARCEEEGEETPLMCACSEGGPAAVELLISAGADVNARDENGMTPLFHAFERDGNEGVIHELVARGADLGAEDVSGNKVWVSGAQDRLIRNYRHLLSTYPVDVNAANTDGDTPLTNAAIWGEPEMVRLLLAAGADPELPDGIGATPTDCARCQGHQDIARFLVRHLGKRDTGQGTDHAAGRQAGRGKQRSLRHRTAEGAEDGAPRK